MNTIKSILITILFGLMGAGCSADLTPKNDLTVRPESQEGGYLFAFITNSRYYMMHYALSRDGYNWHTLNGGNIVYSDYKGHPDICEGGDGKYYMIGVRPLTLWVSDDCVDWDVRSMDEEVFNSSRTIGYYCVSDFGAPKMYFDKDSGQYIITWHACQVEGINDWQSMRTLYVLTKDFKTFTEPKLLFNFTGTDADMSIIDTIIRKIGDKYYAILKDERDLEDAPETGKTVRIAVSDNLTGPYSNPGAPVTTLDLMREAPMFVQLPDNRYAIFAESYNSRPFGYQMFTSDSMEGPWVENSFVGPVCNDGTDRPGARHGCIIHVPENVYQALENGFNGNETSIIDSKKDIGFDMTDNTVYALDGTAEIVVRLANGQKATEDIPVNLVTAEEPKDKIATYNNKYGSSFALMDESAFEATASVIKAGENSVSVKVKVNLDNLSQKFAGKPFALPVAIDAGEKYRCRATGFVVGPVIRKEDGVVKIYTYGSTPTAQVYYSDNSNSKAVLGIPGGGYGGLAEGEIAHFKEVFQNKGVTVAVVYYRMPNGNYTVPATDAYNVLRLMKDNRDKWGGYSKIGVMGGSAGAHVATTLSSYVPEMIDFQVLLYPLITMNPQHTHWGSYGALFKPATKALEDAFSSELHVTSKTPPAYIGYSLDDDVVDPIYNGQAYARACEKNGVPYLEKPHATGGHWVGSWTDYPTSLYQWLETIK